MRLLRSFAALAALAFLVAPETVQAQQVRVVATCGNQALRVQDGSTQFMDQSGRLCINNVGPPGSSETDVRTNGTLNAATLNAAYTVLVDGQGTVGFNVAGLTASGATMVFEQLINGGTNAGGWTPINEVNAGTGVITSSRTTDGQFRLGASGRTAIRLRISAVGTGTITIDSSATVREALVTLVTPLPNGANLVGAVGSPTAAAGKTVQTSVAIPANTSTTLVAANTNRIAIEIQCDGTAAVGIDRNGGTLTATQSSWPVVIPAVAFSMYTPAAVPLTAMTAYTATAQTCRVADTSR